MVMDLKRRLGMMSCIWRQWQVIMILFTYLCNKIFLLLNFPAAVGTTLRWRCNSRRGYLKQISRIELCMVDKGFGGRQYQKTTLASNPKRDQSGNTTYQQWSGNCLPFRSVLLDLQFYVYVLQIVVCPFVLFILVIMLSVLL